MTVGQVKIKENILVARGTTVSAIGGDWDAAPINDIITDEGFMSTSLREETAIDFVKRKGERGILMYIKLSLIHIYGEDRNNKYRHD